MKRESATSLTQSGVNDKKSPTRDNKSYSNLNLLKRLNTGNFQDLCRAKKPIQENQDDSPVSSTIEEQYEELSDKVKELYQEFQQECLTNDIQNKLANMPELLVESPLNYISYIKAMVHMIGKTMKEQDKISLGRKAEKQIDDYELVLQKAECDIKRHIRNEQQLQHVIDSMQARLDEYDRDKDNFVVNAKNLLRDAKKDNSKLIDLIRQRDAEIGNVNTKTRQKDETIKSYEERLLSIPILEHKMKSLKDRHAKEKEQVKQYYKQEFIKLTKEVQQIHKILAMNITIDEKIKVFERELYTYRDFNTKKIQSLEDKIRNFDENHERIDPEASHAILTTDHYEAGGCDSTARLSAVPSKEKFCIRKPKTADISRSIANADVRSMEEKSFRVKQQVMKKKAEISNEINVLSIGRVRDLNHELASNRSEFLHPKSSKHFDNYFRHFAEKLTELNQLNEKEKECLKSLRPDHVEPSKKNSIASNSLFTSAQPASRHFNDDDALMSKLTTPTNANRRLSKSNAPPKTSTFHPKIQIFVNA